MLVLTRKLGEVIKIGDKVKVVVVSIEGGSVKLGVEAPEEISVHREEVYEKIAAENKSASAQLDKEKAKALKTILSRGRGLRSAGPPRERIFDSGRKMAERKTVLVIDDQKIVLKFTEEFFRRLNFDVHLASDGYEGLKIALSSVPDLILLDIMMPRLDGFKTLQVLKSNELTKNIPAIVMTGYSDRINVLSAGKLGAFAVITKPLTEEILFEKLRELFGERFVQSIIPQDPKEMENPFGVNQEEYDSLVRGMVEEFLKYYSEQVAELEQAIHEKDIDAIRKITHAIKGTGGSFGYDEATTLAVQLNEVVHASSINWNEAEELLVRLKNRLQK